MAHCLQQAHTYFNKATPPNSQIVPFPKDQIFERLRLWSPFLFTPHCLKKGVSRERSRSMVQRLEGAQNTRESKGACLCSCSKGWSRRVLWVLQGWVNRIELKSMQSALGSFYCFTYFFFKLVCAFGGQRATFGSQFSPTVHIPGINLSCQAWQPCLGLWEGHISYNVQQSLRGGRVEGRDCVRTQWQWCKTEVGEGNSPCVAGKAEEYLYSIFGMHSEGGTNEVSYRICCEVRIRK